MEPAAAAGVGVATELAVRGGSQLVRSGAGKITKITKWLDRAKGLKLLKNLPKGPLEAFVFGEDDVTPELLAALSLGGTPGLQLSIIALLKRYDYFKPFMLPPNEMEEIHMTVVDTPPEEDEAPRSRMDGTTYYTFTLLDDRSSQMTMRVHVFGDDRSSSLKMRLGGSRATLSNLVVVAFREADGNNTSGLVVRSEDGVYYYYCENQCGELAVSDIDVPPSGIDVHDPNMFLVSPRVLMEYSDFTRLVRILCGCPNEIVKLLGVYKVAKELGEEFVAQIAGDGIPLLSIQHLRNVHNNPGRCTPTLKMPTDEDLRTRVEEATARLRLRGRDAGLVLFSTMQKIVSDFVQNIESEAAGSGNVGVRPYEKKRESNLISCSIVQAVGIDATFAISEGFKKHKVNIGVSPGCTALYFPGLSLTVALPEGFEVQSRRMVLTPACPFTQELEESLPILLDLAPKLADEGFAHFAKTLSSELAKDPALTLSPVTEAVVRAISPRGRPRDALYLTDLFDYLKEHNPKRTWKEASVAGILSQLGMTFSTPPGKEGCEVEDFRCFFQVCREVWPSTCLGAELIVDCVWCRYFRV